MADSEGEERWGKTATLGGVALGLAFGGALVLAIMAGWTTGSGFPFVTLFAVGAFPLVLAALILWFAKRQAGIDRQFGHFED